MTVEAIRPPALLRRGVGAVAGDALRAALIASLVSIGVIGFEIVNSSEGLRLQEKLPYVGTIVALTFLSVLAKGLLHTGRPQLPLLMSGIGTAWMTLACFDGTLAVPRPFGVPLLDYCLLGLCAVFLWLSIRSLTGGAIIRASDLPAIKAIRQSARSATPLAGLLLVAFAVVLPALPFADRRVVDVATLILTYVMLGWGLNIVVGMAGLLDLGYVAFYAVGAYSYALLSTSLGLSFWICVPIAGLLAALAGIALGLPVLRLRGDYLAIVTLGFGEMVRLALVNWASVTGGPNGINNVARPSFFGLDFAKPVAGGETTFSAFFGLAYSPMHRVVFLYFLILGLALITNFFVLRVRRTPTGRAWEALREDEIACRSLGINTVLTKLTAFASGAMFAGFAGSFFAARQGFVSPESFVFMESAVILAIVVLGGLGSQLGVALAAIVLIGLPEYFRELRDYRMIAFGLGMVIIMVWRPSGFLSSRAPTIAMEERGWRAKLMRRLA